MGEYKSKGYVSLHREVMDHWLWEDKPFARGQAWIDLIMLASWKDEPFQSSKRQLVNAERGKIYKSIKMLSDRWGWSWDKTRAFLKLLEQDGMIQIETGTNGATITLVNYGKFQNQVGANRERIESKSRTNRERIETCNKDNNINKVNNPLLYSPQRGELPDGRDFDPFDERNNEWFADGYRVDDDGKWVKAE